MTWSHRCLLLPSFAHKKIVSCAKCNAHLSGLEPRGTFTEVVSPERRPWRSNRDVRSGLAFSNSMHSSISFNHFSEKGVCHGTITHCTLSRVVFFLSNFCSFWSLCSTTNKSKTGFDWMHLSSACWTLWKKPVSFPEYPRGLTVSLHWARLSAFLTSAG